jgi:hypothetical protein
MQSVDASAGIPLGVSVNHFCFPLEFELFAVLGERARRRLERYEPSLRECATYAQMRQSGGQCSTCRSTRWMCGVATVWWATATLCCRTNPVPCSRQLCTRAGGLGVFSVVAGTERLEVKTWRPVGTVRDEIARYARTPVTIERKRSIAHTAAAARRFYIGGTPSLHEIAQSGVPADLEVRICREQRRARSQLTRAPAARRQGRFLNKYGARSEAAGTVVLRCGERAARQSAAGSGIVPWR